ncbi:MAG: DUF115 domain-containing protein [Alphaproteobacteria bacterium]|nr:DUF115 domain-containing protein [Alphaproteobacteria bacterium]
MKIIDCTIRDGGHLNNWEFDPDVVKNSYYAALKSGVDFFEIGYRFPFQKKGCGAYGYSKDEFLFSTIEPNDKCKLLLMINASNAAEVEVKECKPELTPIKGIRVAAYPYEYEKAFTLLEELKNKGYLVYLNLMAASEINDVQYDQLKEWKNKNIIDCIYFADSFGSFLPTDIPYFIKKLQSLGFENVGFHSHNNLQMAFANTLIATDLGANYVDGSIYGMGRGAGNLPIEIFLGYLEKKGLKQYNTVPYLEVIDRYFYTMHREIEWGYKLETLIGGLANVHPYYIEEIFKRNTYTVDEIWNATKIIKENCPTSFSLTEFNQTLNQRFYTPINEENAGELIEKITDELRIIRADDAFKLETFTFRDSHKKQKFLIIANGPSLTQYLEEIKDLIKQENLITIGVNNLQNLIIPNYHIFINRKRLQKYVDKTNSQSQLLFPSYLGKQFVEEHTQNLQSKINYFNLETIDNNKVVEFIDGININTIYPNVSIAAIGIAKLMGASEIFAVGIDGYIDELNKKMVYFYNENDTPDNKKIASLRYEMFAKELERTNTYLQKNTIPFYIITPTSHKKYFKNLLNL